MFCDEIVKCCLQTNKQDLITKNYNFVVENIPMAWDLRLTETEVIIVFVNLSLWVPVLGTVVQHYYSLLADNDISPAQALGSTCFTSALPSQVLSVNEGGRTEDWHFSTPSPGVAQVKHLITTTGEGEGGVFKLLKLK